jgi:hypothetical protein
MDGAPESQGSMILVLLDKQGEPQILLGDQPGPGSAGVPPNAHPEAGSSDNQL